MGMEISYRNYTNGSFPFLRDYEPGDVLIAGWQGVIEVDDPTDVHQVAERLFIRHNRDDRPDGQMCPSMSVGDVVVIGEVALTVTSAGFAHRSIDPSDVVDHLPWVEWIGTPQALALRPR